MKDNPMWISVTNLMKQGAGEFIKQIVTHADFQDNIQLYIDRINRVYSILEKDVHIEKVTGDDKTVDVVVDIFNLVNSGGTKLSKGDLALAKICAAWPEARDELKTCLDKWKRAGFYFKLEWLLRIVTTVTTGEAFYTALKNISIEEFKIGLTQAEKYVNTLLNMISGRLGLDHDRVLGSRYSFPLLARYIHDRKGKLEDFHERDRLLYWYIHTFLWGRYSGSTESVLNQDLRLIQDPDKALDNIINQLRQNRGDLKLQPNDFVGWNRGARFYPLLYMLTRVWHAKDWGTGIELTNHLLGNLSSLQLHHIFPKALLYKHGYSIAEVNALANFTFLTQETNLEISDRAPVDYFPEIQKKHPGALESHWIPIDPELWHAENYLSFLEERRKLLANVANEFLNNLFEGEVPETQEVTSILEREARFVPGGIESAEEEQLLQNFNDWITDQGLPSGEFLYELVDQETNEPLAVLDLAWPDGLQEGFSQPVALLIDDEKETRELVNRAGFLYFTNVETLRLYVKREILVLEEY
jgi:hypothetical protein